MNILLVDIAGTVDEYSAYLSEAIAKRIGNGDRFRFMCTPSSALKNAYYTKLVSFIPSKYKRSEAGWKRTIKAFETIFNYLYVILCVRIRRIDVVHFQWFPFLAIAPIEKYVLKAIHFMSPHSKVVYTHHNVYPHNSTQEQMVAYRNRLMAIAPLIDQFICHTESSKAEIIKEFSISDSKLNVVNHGIFFPREKYADKYKASDKKRVLMYGMQEPYKGTDLMVKAYDLLPSDYKDKLELTIVGRTQDALYKEYKELAEKNHITWKPERISNVELYEAISASDLLVYPYRKISQSGALLLGLYFKKNILTSDLPSFKETLYNFKNGWFCKSNDVESLMNALKSYVDSPDAYQEQVQCVDALKQKYAWDTIACDTICVYRKQYHN